MGFIHAMAILLLNLAILSTLVSGGLLFPRQGTTTSPALPNPSSSSIPEENDPNDPSRPTLVTTTDTTSSALPSTTTTTNNTSTNTTTATTNSTDLNPTITSNPTPLNNTNDPGACHKDFDSNLGVFASVLCHPLRGDLIPTNSTYRMTWDPALFPKGANITITLFPSNFSSEVPKPLAQQVDDTIYVSEDPQPALQGHAWVNVPTSLLNGTAAMNATVVLFRQGGDLDGPNDPGQYLGPEVVVFDPAKGNGTATSSGSGGGGGGGGKKLGEEVGIPIGLIAFLAILAGLLFFVLRRRKASRSGDYLSSRSQNQSGSRGARGAGGGAGGLVEPHRRTESFHDEPTMGGGVELQNTRSSRAYSGASSVSRLSEGDSWGWGSPGGVSTTVTGGSGNGNVFREELGRQQMGRGY